MTEPAHALRRRKAFMSAERRRSGLNAFVRRRDGIGLREMIRTRWRFLWKSERFKENQEGNSRLSLRSKFNIFRETEYQWSEHAREAYYKKENRHRSTT
jgi:hypothetical protein